MLGLKQKSHNIPKLPGVYIMKNSSQEIIYIGKAKSLRARVSTYFNFDKNKQEKVKKMVSHIKDFSYIITDSEFEALVLECSLIKQYKPKYNILLKDDKGYNYIKITNEEWPKLLHVKQVQKDGATYLGPYMSSGLVQQLIEGAKNIFKLPSCNKNFSKGQKTRPCLNYYINRCLAPCTGKVPRQTYIESLEQAINFFKHGDKNSVKQLTKSMQTCAQNLNFERAAELRDKIKAINQFKTKQKVVCLGKNDQDVIATAKNSEYICFEVFRFISGSLSDRENFFFNNFEEIEVARAEFIQQYYIQKQKIPSQILVDGKIEGLDALVQWLSKKAQKSIKIILPQKGNSAKILKMCQNNATESLFQKINYKNQKKSPLKQMQELLNLKNPPNHIEAYDISNLQGSGNVGAMVVFSQGKPLKSAYKKFKIKNVFLQDDYASMCEVINRRFKEYEINKEEAQGFGKLPDLILLDGGKGHVNAVKKELERLGYGSIPLFGMVKDGNHKTRAITSATKQIEIKSNAMVFSFIFSIQEEVHRFAIGYHKTIRKKTTISSNLLSIPGVGQKRAKLILKYFKSINNLKKASLKEIELTKGLTKPTAKAIYEYFNK